MAGLQFRFFETFFSVNVKAKNLPSDVRVVKWLQQINPILRYNFILVDFYACEAKLSPVVSYGVGSLQLNFQGHSGWEGAILNPTVFFSLCRFS